MSTLKNNEQKENEAKNNYTVYMHINKINDKKYVGITSRTPELRWQNGTAYKRNPHFNAAIQKYGWDNYAEQYVNSALKQLSILLNSGEYIYQGTLKELNNLQKQLDDIKKMI